MINYPNAQKSYKNYLQNTAHSGGVRGVAQSPYPIYSHKKAYLSKQLPWHAAGDPRLACGMSRVRVPAPAGALWALFFHPLFLLPSPFSHLLHQPRESVRVIKGGYAHSNMHIFHFELIDLDL